MKMKIMEKLFNESPLSNEEILYIGTNLADSSPNKLPEYDHNSNSVLQACGLKESDFNEINRLIKSGVSDKNFKTSSEKIEAFEKIASSSALYLRLIIYNYVKMQDNLGGTTSSKSFKDFLDFLREQTSNDDE